MAQPSGHIVRRCLACGAVPEASDRFCTSCGRNLTDPPGAPATRRTAPRTALIVASLTAVSLMVVAGLVVLTWMAWSSAMGASDRRSPEGSGAASAAGLGQPFGTALDVTARSCGFIPVDCVIVTVPTDHDDPDGGGEFEVRFGLHEADPGRRIGTLVVATGGPGSSGIELAGYYLSVFPERVLDRYDIVFFEQRGVGRSEPIRCREAERAYPAAWNTRDEPPDRALDLARAWVAECLQEAEVTDPSRLDAFSTAQAAADLDAYLNHLGADRVVIFGESYGTRLAQTYAAQRPERVEALILDAVVDPSLEPMDASLDQVKAFSGVLARVFDACVDDPLCEADFGDTTPAAVWDAVADRLRGGDARIEMPLKDGSRGPVSFRLSDLVDGTSALLYTEAERAMLLHALAWAARDDLGPLVRLTSRVRGLDPETGEFASGLALSTAAFLAIYCQDWPAANAEETAAELHARIERLPADERRLADLVGHDIVCLGGFAGVADPEAVEPLDADFPILVLTSTADPATPTQWAEAVADRASNAYLLVTEDSSHGTFGWGFACPDELVIDFLVDGDVPDGRTECEGGYLVEPYRPLPVGGLDAYPDVLDALVAVEGELAAMPDYVYWDGSPQRLGCRHGGRMEMTWDADEVFELHQCEVLPGWPLSGTVKFRPDFTTVMTLQVPNGELVFESTDTLRVTVTGTLDGEPIDLSR